MSEPRPYYDYGEGAITHGDEPCEHGIGLHHPLIQRTAWPSRWAYYRNLLRLKLGPMRGFRVRGGKPEWRPSLLDRLIYRLLGKPFPDHPTVWAPLRPEESIYPRAVEDAEGWAAMRDRLSEPSE